MNLKKIAKTAIRKERENLKFRAFLKGYDIAIEELDAKIHEIYREVESNVDCTQCGNCCKIVGPILIQKDIEKLARSIGIQEKEFKAEYLKEDEDGNLVFKKIPCPLLKSNLCTHYDSRPEDCRSFPHLHKEEQVFRLMQTVQNYSICPIVYNVYEELKIKFADEFDVFVFDFY